MKQERIKRQTYRDSEEASRDVFNYIEMFYNPKRRHSFNNGLSPVEYEKKHFERLGSVYKTRSDSDSFIAAILLKTNITATKKPMI